MKLIKADQERRLELPGVPQPVRRPVDIDKSSTDFTNLRSLRIYCFDAGSVIDGHAEEDEVLIVVLAGSVELTLSEHESMEASRTYVLSAAAADHGDPVVAYLPPHAAYRLVPRTEAQIAYARATPSDGKSPTVFAAMGWPLLEGVTVLLEESGYAQKLRLRLLRIEAVPLAREIPLIEAGEEAYEVLIHVITAQAAGATTLAVISGQGNGMGLDSWDTVAAYPGDRPVLRVAEGVSALVLVVMSR